MNFHYYPFMVILDRCNGNFNTLDDRSGRMCVAHKTKDLYSNVFNMITWINEAETLLIHISCDRKFDGRKRNSDQKRNNNDVKVSVKKQ